MKEKPEMLAGEETIPQNIPSLTQEFFGVNLSELDITPKI